MAFISPTLGKTSIFTNNTNLLSSKRERFSPTISSSPYLHNKRSSIVCLSDEEHSNTSGATNAAASKEARLELWREVEALKKSLSIAVNAERYVDAARLRDQIESLSLADDYVRTETELKKAVKEERFAEAARLRDVLKLLDPPPGLAALRGNTESTDDNTSFAKLSPNDVDTTSTTLTDGIKIYVESYYMPEQSVPEQERLLFGYKVKISNEGKDTCQLVSRHWIIKSPEGAQSEVKGAGVIGKQPVLQPGESFEYTSACPLSGPLKAGQSVVGSMKGQYTLCKGDAGEYVYKVDINTFHFVLPFKNYRPEGESSSGNLWPKP